ncbi:hypothetical protein PFISCL1PPCAC_6327, partial [Pristionchus fissidentatus]
YLPLDPSIAPPHSLSLSSHSTMKGIPDTVLWRSTATLSALSPLEKKHSFMARPSFSNHRTSLNSPALPFDLTMLSVLQGIEMGWEERQELAQRVAALPSQNKKKLIDFIEGSGGAAMSAVENNACKAFQCIPSQLSEILKKEDGVDQLTEHFQTLVSELIPTVESVLYPLQSSYKHFSIRRILLRCFRDQVLLRVFNSVPSRIPRLEHLVFTVLFESYDNSLEFDRFEKLANTVLGRDY